MRQIARLASKKVLRVIGLMSGTSCDGVDAALVEVGRRGVKVLAFHTFPYRPALRRAILDLCRPAEARGVDICHMNFALGEEFAAAAVGLARRAGVELGSIDLIGSHGQTICHLPHPRRHGRRAIRSTLQIGEPSVIAERTGITTVADFRPRDMAAGGQGAPLVPYVDWLLLGHGGLGRACQNIGGIANVTYLPPGGGIESVLAFDTGPGNMVIDRIAERATGGRLGFDRDGRLARAGRVRQDLLDRWMRHAYFRRRPPKSTGREEFGRYFADGLFGDARRRGAAAQDIAATATALTAASIADAYRRFLPAWPDEAILSGGGARNPALMDMLRQRLAPAAVRTSDELGLDADAKEAVAFAVLAAETIRGRANNVPAATGARRAVVLGKVVPGGTGAAAEV